MNEEHDSDNEDYDREELEHVENMLYANIHHNTGCDELSTSKTLSEADQINDIDSASNTPTDQRNSAPRRNTKRYWSSNTTPSTSNFVPYFKEKHSGIYKTVKNVIGDASNANPEMPKKVEPLETNVAPKQFTPYVSFLPLNDSISIDIEEPISTAKNIEENPMKELKTNNDLVRKNLAAKHINPFSKKHTVDTYKKLVEKNEIEVDDINEDASLDHKKRLNPFNPLSRKAKKKKSEIKQLKNVRKNREVAANTSIINVDVDDTVDDTDDDVIILPTEDPPLVCIESSDEETNPILELEHEFTEPNAVRENRRRPRCASPTSSIQSADDFLVQNEQSSFGFDTFGTLSDEDLCHVSETVENQIRDKATEAGPSTRATIPNDNAIFTPPKQMQKDKTKPNTKKSYEVVANNFTAVDVYESESSDMPDSIYAKGGQKKRSHISDSDTSSVESMSIAKSKRLRKRKKSSGSAKESDHMHSDDSSSDLPEEDENETEDDEEPNENSYLVRGEALGKVKNTNNKKKSNKNVNEKRSKDDFIIKLSSIVNGLNESDDNDDRGTSTESVEARDIVQTVLQRRTKKSKQNQPTEEEINQTDGENPQPWAVTDQVGETDDLNLGRIFDESAFDTVNNKDIQSKTNESISSEQENNDNNDSNQANNKTILNEQKTGDEDDMTNNKIINFFETEIGWNDEMKRFYNESWGGETFSVKNIRSCMPRGILNWMIINKDKFPSSNNNKGRQFRCLNCQEKGHLARNCPRPPSKKRCYMCGIEGHLEPKCPNKMCLRCGRRTQRYQQGCNQCARDKEMLCYLCKQKGHRQFVCPDRWRRYHSTTTTNTPLIREQKSTGIRSKVKYCCLCGGPGHYAEQCNRAGRAQVPLSMRISSYQPLYKKLNDEKNISPQCTILVSDIDDYSFNFGKVSGFRNNIYSRFIRAVNLNPNKSTASENDVICLDESNLNDSSDRPIEVYDDDKSLDDELEDISSVEPEFSENVTDDDSFMIIDSLGQETEEEDVTINTSNELKAEEINILPAEKQAEIDRLDSKIETLRGLKEKMMLHKSNHETSFEIDTSVESDANVSESKSKIDVSTSSVLPDFIPLNSNEPDKYEPTRSPSPAPADSTTTNEKNDATILLTEQNCKELLTDQGNKFLRESESRFNVSVRLEWRQFGNVLIVNGIPNYQQDFRCALKEFLDSIENRLQINRNSLPKHRDSLMKYVRDQFAQLDSPICNSKNMADVHSIYHRIQILKKNISKATKQKISRLRKCLNMILFGRYGLGGGQAHITEIQYILRKIRIQNHPNVSIEIRDDLSKHMDYIFTGQDNKFYGKIIEEYNEMKRNKCLPPLNLDRKLIGLKINVHPVTQDNRDKTPNRNNSFENSSYSNYNTNFNRNATPMNSNNQNNKYNTTPSSIDIQINVSTPSASTSTSYHNPDDIMLHDNNFPPLKGNPLDKWKY